MTKDHKRIRLRYLCVLLGIALAGPVFGQHILKGKVVDLEGRGLPAVTVLIPELDRSELTNNDGSFRFTNLPAGLIKVQCTHVSFQTASKDVDTKVSVPQLITLRPASKQLDEVLVTSNQTQTASKVPYTVRTVQQDQLRLAAQPTLQETLAQQPGVELISGGSGISKPVIRGSSFNKVVMYASGTKIESQQWDDDHDAGIAEAGVEKVEVVYGPSALVYGADALGGALVFADAKPAVPGTTIGHAGVSMFSNTKGLNIDAGVRSTSKKGYFVIADVNSQSHADYRQGGSANKVMSAYAVNSRYSNLSAKLKLGVSRKWGVSKLSYSVLHSLAGMIAEDSLDVAEVQTAGVTNRSVQAPYQDVYLHVVSSENTFITGNSRWNVNVAWQNNNRREFEAGETDRVAMGLSLHTITYDAKWTSNALRRLRLVTGIQGMVQQNRNFGDNLAVPDANVNDHAAYGLVQYNPVSEKWSFSGGIRYDLRQIMIRKTPGTFEGEVTLDSLEKEALNKSSVTRNAGEYTRNYHPFSFSIGTVYHVNDHIRIKANVATGFTAPNYAELSTFGRHAGTYRFEVGNADLRVQQNVEGDLSMGMDAKNISLSFSVFYNYIRDNIYLAPTKDSIYDLQLIAYEQGDASIYGGEAEVTVHPEAAKWFELQTALSGSIGKLKEGYLPYSPASKWITVCTLQPMVGKQVRPMLRGTVSYHFAQNHPALYETASSGYTLFSMLAGANIQVGKQAFSATVFCNNLFNTAYYNHLSILKDIPVFNKGRDVGFRINYTF